VVSERASIRLLKSRSFLVVSRTHDCADGREVIGSPELMGRPPVCGWCRDAARHGRVAQETRRATRGAIHAVGGTKPLCGPHREDARSSVRPEIGMTDLRARLLRID
jgi:hypothetical protein